jgi:DNA-binding transcriptional regulator PaaX
MVKWRVQIRSYHVAALLQREIQHRENGTITQSEALDLFSPDHHQKGPIWGAGLLVKAGLLDKKRGVWSLTDEGRRRLITEDEALRLAERDKWENPK